MEGIQSFLSSPYFPNPTPRIALVHDEILTASYMYECCTGNHFLRPPDKSMSFCNRSHRCCNRWGRRKKTNEGGHGGGLGGRQGGKHDIFWWFFFVFLGEFFWISWWNFLKSSRPDGPKADPGPGSGVRGSWVRGRWVRGPVGSGSGGFGSGGFRVRWVQGPVGRGCSVGPGVRAGGLEVGAQRAPRLLVRT